MTLLSLTTRPFRVQAASAVAAANSLRFHTHGGSPASPDREAATESSEAWFVKVASTLFAVNSPSLDSCLPYLRANLTNPLIAFEVIERFDRPELGFKFLEFSRLNLNLTHSFGTYNWMIRSFCQMGLHDLAEVLFGYMISDGHLTDTDSDRNLLWFMVTAFVQARRFDIVHKLLSELRGLGVPISPFVYNNLLNELVKLNQVHEAVRLFKDFLVLDSCPDTWTFNILIRGLCRVGEVDRAFEFLNDMRSFGCLPDIVTYNTLINGLCRINDLDRGRSLLQELQSGTDCCPDVVSYTSVMSGFCNSGQLEDAYILFQEMVRNGVEPSIITFNKLIDGYGKINDMVAAEAVYEKMNRYGCSPDVVTFTSLIDGYCKSGQVSLGMKLWDAMRVRNMIPNAYTYAVLINALCKENRLHEARGILTELKSSNVVARAFMYNPVIDGFCKAGNVDEANAIAKEMEEEKKCVPDKVTFTILIIGHCMKGRMSEAIGLVHKMLKIGCSPDEITISSLTSCLLKAGLPNEAFQVKQMLLEGLNSGRRSSYRKIDPLVRAIDIPVAA
ncbi:Pentatricopeptide repeat-containing protein At2g06000 [Linum grandiflorum]